MRANGEWNQGFISDLATWLGPDGLKFFRDVLDKYGGLNVVLKGVPGDGNIPHPVHMREGMKVRNKMRDLHTAMGHPHEHAHWYDNHWQAAVKACLGIPTACIDCDDTGKGYQLLSGRYEEVPCRSCKGGSGDG